MLDESTMKKTRDFYGWVLVHVDLLYYLPQQLLVEHIECRKIINSKKSIVEMINNEKDKRFVNKRDIFIRCLSLMLYRLII